MQCNAWHRPAPRSAQSSAHSCIWICLPEPRRAEKSECISIGAERRLCRLKSMATQRDAQRDMGVNGMLALMAINGCIPQDIAIGTNQGSPEGGRVFAGRA